MKPQFRVCIEVDTYIQAAVLFINLQKDETCKVIRTAESIDGEHWVTLDEKVAEGK